MTAPTGTPADLAYAERNRCAALIARMALVMGLKAGTAKHPAEDTAWEDDWRTILFIDLPTGQVSWHFHDGELELLEGLPAYPGKWDGHDTPTKYERVRMAYAPKPEPQPCGKCAGCGKIANDDDGTPWKYWLELPLKSAVAVVAGIVKPLPCPACKGSGVQS